MAGRVSLVQSGQITGLPRSDSRPWSQQRRAQRVSAAEQRPAFSEFVAPGSRAFRRRSERLDRRLRYARDLEAALLQRTDARSARGHESVDRTEFSGGTREAMGAATSRSVDCRARSVGRPSPPGEGRSGRDAFFSRSALPLSRRRCLRFLGEAPSAFATPRISRQTSVASSGGTMGAKIRGAPAQSYLPRAAG